MKILLLFAVILLLSCSKEIDPVIDCYGNFSENHNLDSIVGTSLGQSNVDIVFDVYFPIASNCETFDTLSLEYLDYIIKIDLYTNIESCSHCDQRKSQMKQALVLNFDKSGIYYLRYNDSSTQPKTKKIVIQ